MPQPAQARSPTGAALLAYYHAARAGGLPLYDDSWVPPANSYFTWKQGKRNGRCARTWGGTVFEHLVRLGVLEKIAGPLPCEHHLGPLEKWPQPEDSR